MISWCYHEAATTRQYNVCHKAVVSQPQSGTPTTAVWYSHYRSQVLPLPQPGTLTTSAWYCHYQALQNFWYCSLTVLVDYIPSDVKPPFFSFFDILCLHLLSKHHR